MMAARRQLELIVGLLERVPILVGGAVALAEVMTGLVPADDTSADDVIGEATGSNSEPHTAPA
jgi:hypothetical protein